MKRRTILIAALAAPLTAPRLGLSGPVSFARAAEEELYPDERIMGDPEAPITIIEYASMTCPHCARFHETILQDLKRDWIDTGRAKLAFRHFPLDGLALRASMAAECLEGPAYFGFIDALFETQSNWSTANDPVAALAAVAALAGLDRETFNACISDQAEAEAIMARAREGQETYGIDATPSFVVGGERLVGVHDYDAFAAALGERES